MVHANLKPCSHKNVNSMEISTMRWIVYICILITLPRIWTPWWKFPSLLGWYWLQINKQQILNSHKNVNKIMEISISIMNVNWCIRIYFCQHIEVKCIFQHQFRNTFHKFLKNNVDKMKTTHNIDQPMTRCRQVYNTITYWISTVGMLPICFIPLLFQGLLSTTFVTQTYITTIMIFLHTHTWCQHYSQPPLAESPLQQFTDYLLIAWKTFFPMLIHTMHCQYNTHTPLTSITFNFIARIMATYLINFFQRCLSSILHISNWLYEWFSTKTEFTFEKY